MQKALLAACAAVAMGSVALLSTTSAHAVPRPATPAVQPADVGVEQAQWRRGGGRYYGPRRHNRRGGLWRFLRRL